MMHGPFMQMLSEMLIRNICYYYCLFIIVMRQKETQAHFQWDSYFSIVLMVFMNAFHFAAMVLQFT